MKPLFFLIMALACLACRPLAADAINTLKIQALAQDLNSADPATRRKAAVDMRELGADAAPATWALMQRLSDPDQGVRDEAYSTLSGLAREPAALAALSQGIYQGDRQVRLRCLDLLALAGQSGQAVSYFFSRALTDQDAEVRQHAGDLLAELAKTDPAARQALLSATVDSDPAVQSASTNALRTHTRLPPGTAPDSLQAAKGDLSSSDRTVRFNAVQRLETMGSKAIAATPWLKQVFNGSDEVLRAAARKALRAILQPTEDTDFFFYLDYSPDWCKEGLLGHVKRLVQTTDQDESSLEIDFDRRGYKTSESFTDANGNPVRAITYTRDAAGNLVGQTDNTGTGLLARTSTAAYDSLNRKIKETVMDGTSPLPLYERSYEYDGRGNLVRYQVFKGMKLEPLTIEFKFNDTNQLVERRVSRGRLLPVELTRFAWDDNGNTRARWEYFDNLPLVEDKSFTVDYTGGFDPRRVLRYYWQYRFNEQGEKLGQDLYWDDNMLEETNHFEWDENKNISRHIRSDEDGHLLEDNSFIWDRYHNLVNRRYFNFRGGDSILQASQYEYDSKGNWTRLSGNLPFFEEGPHVQVKNPRKAHLIEKAATFHRKFEYWDNQKDDNCIGAVNPRLPPL